MFRSDWRACSLATTLVLALAASGYVGQVSASAANGTNQYHLGHRATAAQIAGWNIDVLPDGTGLPDGHGSVAQGEQVYGAKCASCHGPFGQSNEYQSLAEVKDKLNYAPTLYDYINRAMPFPDPKTLTPDQVYAVTAYVLNLLDIVPADFVADQHSLPQVKMPNRDRLQPFPGMMSVSGAPDVHNAACMKNCEKTVKISSRLPAGFVAKMYGDLSDNFRRLTVMNRLGPPSPAAGAGAAAATGPDLIRKYGCVACHSVDHKIVGPAFREVAAKYHGDADAPRHLVRKIRHGGAGVWGDVPMPPQADPSDVDLATIVKWVLSLPPEK